MGTIFLYKQEQLVTIQYHSHSSSSKLSLGREQKIRLTVHWFFEKINKMDKSLTIVMKGDKNDQYQKWEEASLQKYTDITRMKEYYKQHKFDNLTWKGQIHERKTKKAHSRQNITWTVL